MSIGKRLKKFNIGGITLENNLLLAPLAGYTDFAFRGMCIAFGASLGFTEMISCKGLVYGSEKTRELLITAGNERVKAVQIFGREPEIMRRAAESEELSKFDIIDINMGCPVPKLYKNGEGSALLGDIGLAERIIREVKRSDKTVTVKLRTGINAGNTVTEEFAKMSEAAGASMITVHGRTRDMYYAGEPDFREIEKAVNAVKIPVIGNGGIFDLESALAMFDNTGCAGIMIARGALYNPRIFAELSGTEPGSLKDAVLKQIDDLKTVFGDRTAAINLRKAIVFYLKGRKDSKRFKDRIFKAESTGELKDIVLEIF